MEQLQLAGFDVREIAAERADRPEGLAWIEVSTFRGDATQQAELQQAVMNEIGEIVAPLGFELSSNGVVIADPDDFRVLRHNPTGRILLRGWLGEGTDSVKAWADRLGVPPFDVDIVPLTPDVEESDKRSNELRARFYDSFNARETTLIAALAQVRAESNHGTSKGSRLEEAVRSFLSQHLPRKYQVGHGEVVDIRGERSRQLDVVVNNDDQPFTPGGDTSSLYLLDGVVACGEVKAKLTTSELDDSLVKGRQLRRLRYRHDLGDVVRANRSDLDRYYASPPFFLVAFECNVSPETIIARVEAADEVNDPVMGGGPLPALDAIFTLDRGVAINYGDGCGSLQFTLPSGESQKGWLWHPPGSALVHLFLWLNVVKPRFTRANPVALNYIEPIGMIWSPPQAPR